MECQPLTTQQIIEHRMLMVLTVLAISKGLDNLHIQAVWSEHLLLAYAKPADIERLVSKPRHLQFMVQFNKNFICNIAIIFLSLKRLSLQLWSFFEKFSFLFKSFVKAELS